MNKFNEQVAVWIVLTVNYDQFACNFHSKSLFNMSKQSSPKTLADSGSKSLKNVRFWPQTASNSSIFNTQSQG
jgi:hypothetical protein